MDSFVFEFAIDYNLLFEVLVVIVILSFFIERSLSVIFESSFFIKWYDPEGLPVDEPVAENQQSKTPSKKKKGIKEFISIAVSIGAAAFWKFDAITILLKSHNEGQNFGYIITGMVIAGGSKASIKLFKDTMGFMSSAEKYRQEMKQGQQTQS